MVGLRKEDFMFYIFLVFCFVSAIFIWMKSKEEKHSDVYDNYLPGDSNLVLLQVNKKKPQVVNLIRKYTHLSKEKSEKLILTLPAVLLFHIDYKLANQIKAHFEKYGAVLEIKRDMMP
jgi:ribosomal protein L7/L12